MTRRRCKAKTKRGTPCMAAPLSDSDFCISHAPEEIRGSTGFGGAQPGSGRPRNPKPSEIARKLIEENVVAVQRPYWRALGFDVVVGDSGPELVELEGGGAKLSATWEGDVYVSEHEDLEAMQKAAERLMDRVYGKPRQEITGAEGAPLALEVTGARIVDDAEAREHAARLRRSVGAGRQVESRRARTRG